jgi:hypothetical protein
MADYRQRMEKRKGGSEWGWFEYVCGNIRTFASVFASGLIV